ncbi:MAG: hypothetical protein D6753_05260, partial [Planctomycetota bacterium]
QRILSAQCNAGSPFRRKGPTWGAAKGTEVGGGERDRRGWIMGTRGDRWLEDASCAWRHGWGAGGDAALL